MNKQWLKLANGIVDYVQLLIIFSVFFMVGNQKVCIKLNRIGSSQKTRLEFKILNSLEFIKRKGEGKKFRYCLHDCKAEVKYIHIYLCTYVCEACFKKTV